MYEKKLSLIAVLNEAVDTTVYTDEFENLLSDSSDSSDDEFIAKRIKRTSNPSNFEKTVAKYTDTEFIKHFRINRNLFKSLAAQFRNSKIYRSLKTSIAYSAEKQIAIFLWFAGHEACSYRDLSNRFDVSISTISLVISRVTRFLSDLASVAFKWPDDEEKRKSETFFKSKHGLPGIIGAIDVTHIVIDPPKSNKNDYLNRENNYSVCLQGICNEDRKFIDVFIGFPGSVDDSRIFKNSFIFPNIERLCEDYQILGNSAYTCSKYVLTPYRDNGHLLPAQLYFNKCLSSSRVVIDHSFGILKQRFRQLLNCKLKGIEKICHFIRACCVLHNLSNPTDLEATESDIGASPDVDASSCCNWNEDNAAGERKRDEICKQLYAQRH